MHGRSLVNAHYRATRLGCASQEVYYDAVDASWRKKKKNWGDKVRWQKKIDRRDQKIDSLRDWWEEIWWWIWKETTRVKNFEVKWTRFLQLVVFLFKPWLALNVQVAVGYCRFSFAKVLFKQCSIVLAAIILQYTHPCWWYTILGNKHFTSASYCIEYAKLRDAAHTMCVRIACLYI